MEILNNTNKSILEKNRINLLYEKFKKEFNNENKILINNIEYLLKIDVFAIENSLYFRQLPIWILGLLFCQSMHLDEIQIFFILPKEYDEDLRPEIHLQEK
jgi:hypothetical protein